MSSLLRDRLASVPPTLRPVLRFANRALELAATFAFLLVIADGLWPAAGSSLHARARMFAVLAYGLLAATTGRLFEWVVARLTTNDTVPRARTRRRA
ncbi:MAG TPA: hypothetical protein VEA99_00065 [Gemmatimonadaceae bacterium]|nr:hypothetical protein [Gemmatimonadaceae bacterium]